MSTINRYGSYNILVPRPDVDEKGHLWEDRKEHIIKTIRNHMDVVGLQEFDTNPLFGQGAYVAEQLISSGWGAYLPEFDETSGFTDVFHHRLPIFWRDDKFRKVDAGVFQLSGHNVMEQLTTPIVENRYCSWVVLECKQTGKHVQVYSLHQQHSTKNGTAVETYMAYRKQHEGLSKLASHVKRSENAVVVLGDFNNTLIPEWFYHATRLKDVWDVCPVEKQDNREVNSFHNWLSPRLTDGEHIDHVLVSDKAIVSEVEVVLSDASDHYPLVASICL